MDSERILVRTNPLEFLHNKRETVDIDQRSSRTSRLVWADPAPVTLTRTRTSVSALVISIASLSSSSWTSNGHERTLWVVLKLTRLTFVLHDGNDCLCDAPYLGTFTVCTSQLQLETLVSFFVLRTKHNPPIHPSICPSINPSPRPPIHPFITPSTVLFQT